MSYTKRGEVAKPDGLVPSRDPPAAPPGFAQPRPKRSTITSRTVPLFTGCQVARLSRSSTTFPMPNSRLPSPPSAQIPSASSLSTVSDTLHLLYHHNKNQHRSAKWFKWLGILKRWTNRLTLELQVAEAQGHLDLAFDDEEAGGIRSVMAHMGRNIVPRCYGAFSTIIADKQFSALGVVLLSALAEIAGLIKMPGLEGGFLPAEAVASRLDISAAATIDDPSVPIHGPENESRGQEDIGEVIGRSEIAEGSLPRRSEKEESESQPNVFGEPLETRTKKGKKRRLERDENLSEEDVSAKSQRHVKDIQAPSLVKVKEKERKKKKKKGNAIDDIFGDLA
ncbi:hypothetical protein CISG_08569 [Coccidioides immitis RMSCC 3703]|nr:hypothetical protein CIRG_09399 [Coccidioides immitis RMSCC 2394]KMU80766.1 hypothetical protein CISG_08569 [Coccidioides immitis RMSCC 3703]